MINSISVEEVDDDERGDDFEVEGGVGSIAMVLTYNYDEDRPGKGDLRIWNWRKGKTL